MPAVHPRLLSLALTVVLGGLLAGCGAGDTPVETNRVGVEPSLAPVVHTPAPLGTNVLSTDPPLVQKLPGATGEAPGTPGPGKAAEASPGQTSDAPRAGN